MELVIKVFWRIVGDAKYISADKRWPFVSNGLTRFDYWSVYFIQEEDNPKIDSWLFLGASMNRQCGVTFFSYSIAIWFSFLQFDLILCHEIHPMVQFVAISVMQDLKNRTLLSMFICLFWILVLIPIVIVT